MKNKEDNAETDVKAYKVEITVQRESDGCEEDTQEKTVRYAVHNKKDVVNVDYPAWEYLLDSVRPMARDGSPVMTIDTLTASDISVSDWLRISNRIKAGEWGEFTDRGGCRTVRITAMSELPEMSPELTIKESCIDAGTCQHIIMNGEALFKEGDSVSGSIFRPHISDEVGKVWEVYIRTVTGIECKIRRDLADFSADCVYVPLSITCKTMEDMRAVLAELGATHPESIKVSYTLGDESGVKAFEADVYLCESMD